MKFYFFYPLQYKFSLVEVNIFEQRESVNTSNAVTGLSFSLHVDVLCMLSVILPHFFFFFHLVWICLEFHTEPRLQLKLVLQCCLQLSHLISFISVCPSQRQKKSHSSTNGIQVLNLAMHI